MMNNKIKNNISRAAALVLTAGMDFSMVSCQSNPDSIIKNKDMDKLISEAEQTEEKKVEMEELVDKYDSYKATVKDDSLKVTLNIDAEVSIPKTDKMSVIRVSQTKITDELLNRVREELVGDTPLYDGTVLLTKTKKDIESEIKFYRDLINELSANQDYEQENKDSLQAEYQESINELEEEYKTATVDINIKDKPSEYKLLSVADEYKKNSSDEYYSWMYSMDKNIESYYGISDAEDKNYISLSVLNSPDYGNRIIYRKDYHGYEFTSSVIDMGMTRWQSDSIPSDARPDTENYEYVQCTEDTVNNITKDEAVKKADEFLQKVGIAGFQAYEGDLYTETADVRYKCDLSGLPCRTYYILKYMRNINGTFVTSSGEAKHNESWNGDDYVKQLWPEESIEIRINDNGIVGFDYYAPITEEETVVDNSALQSFDEIKKTFEKMAVIANAQQDFETVLTVDKVVFGYSRISEKDSFDTGLLVPVWDFFGKNSAEKDDKYGGDGEKVLMTINAIDGSIINRSIGY